MKKTVKMPKLSLATETLANLGVKSALKAGNAPSNPIANCPGTGSVKGKCQE